MTAIRSMNTAIAMLVGLLMLTGCSNILGSRLVKDSSILLPPGAARTIYVQIRNTSENQTATPTNIPSRLQAKGYHVVADPMEAAYWLQTQVIYCHKAGDGVRPEAVAKAGFGAGIGSGGILRSRMPAVSTWTPWAGCSQECPAAAYTRKP